MSLSDRTLMRARVWRHLTPPLADRFVVWGNHAASQPDDCTLGGLLADWRQMDGDALAHLPPAARLERLVKTEGFADGSARLTLETTDAEPHRVEAYGHFAEPLPEDGGDEIVFQVARLTDLASGRQFTVPGGHHAVAEWDMAGSTVWEE